MSAVLIEIAVILLLMVINGLFSMSETAIISARKIRLQQRAEAGDARAKAALEVANEPNALLATVQIGITLIGILTGVVSGATISEEIETVLQGIPALAPYGEAIGVGIVVALITYFTLIIGELVPKNIALTNPEQVAMLVAVPMRRLSRIATPFVKLLDLSTKIALMLLGIKASDEPHVTEDEIKGMMKQGAQTGTFKEVERKIVEQVFWLDDLNATSVMTPRTEIAWLNVNDPPEAIRAQFLKHKYSRYPVAEDSLDNLIGVVRVKDLIALNLHDLDLRKVMQPAVFLPETTSTLKILERFDQEQTHIAFIIDEFGGLQGLVTISDVMEVIMGQGLSGVMRHDSIVRRADGSVLLDGLLTIEEVYNILDIEPPKTGRPIYSTLGGFVLAHMGNIPNAGDTFTAQNYKFEVMDMDGRRVDKVLATPQPPPSDSPSDQVTDAKPA
jgi:putative hemolysin